MGSKGYSFDTNYLLKRFNNIPEIYSRFITDIDQDSSGFLWFTVPRVGVFKFNGNKYRKYDNFEEFPQSIKISSNNRVFLNSTDKLFYYYRKEDRFVEIPFPVDVSKFEILNEKLLLFASSDSLFSMNIDTRTIQFLKQFEKTIREIKYRDGQTIIGTSRKIYLRDEENNNFIELKKDAELLTVDRYDKNYLWLSSDNKILKYDIKNRSTVFQINKKDKVFDFFQLSKQELLYSTSEDLYVINKAANQVIPYSKNINLNLPVMKLFQDKTDILWMGTRYGVVKTYPTDKIEHYTLENDINPFINNFLTGLAVDDHGYAYVINNEHKLFRISKEGKVKRYRDLFKSKTKYFIRAIELDTAGNLWIGTKIGLYKFFLKTEELVKVSDDKVMSLCQLGDEYLAMSNMASIKLLNHNGQSVKKWNIKNVMGISAYDNKTLWLSSHTSGITQFNTETGKKEFTLNLKEKIKTENIGLMTNILYSDKLNLILIGTLSEGVYKYDIVNEQLDLIKKEDGLPSNSILGFAEIEDEIWIHTSRGVGVLKKDEIYLTLDESNNLKCYGMENNYSFGSYRYSSKNLIKTKENGQVYIAGRNGLCLFNINRIYEKSPKMPLVLTDIKVFGQNRFQPEIRKEVKKYVFSYRDDIITLGFAALTFQRLNTNQYAFFLEGFHKNWRYPDGNFINFSNLSPGNYKLKTKYTDYTGQWWEGPIYDIIIKPPFWLTYQFYILSFLFLSVLVGLLIRMKTRQIREEKSSLEYRVLHRSKELQRKTEELEEINKNLEKLVEVRTETLAKTNQSLKYEILKKERFYKKLQYSRKELETNLKHQTKLSKISMELISLENFDDKIENILQIIGEELQVSSIFLFEDKHRIQESSKVYQWVRDPSYKKFVKINYRKIKTWLAALHSNELLVFDDISTLDRDVQAALSEYKIKSILILPLIVNEKFHGFIGCDYRKIEQPWKESIVNYFQTIAHIMGNAFERKNYQFELMESEKTSRALLNASESFAILFDIEGNITITNQKIVEKWNKSPEEIVGHSIFDFFTKEQLKKRIEQFDKCVETGKSVNFEDKLHGQYFSNMMNPIFNRKGEVYRVAHFAHDITKQKKAEKILKQHQEELRKEVEIRTRELSFINNELKREIKHREKAEENLIKSEKIKRENLKKLALQLAHEIKNPLSSINSSAQLVETIQKMKPNVESTIKHMQRITNNVDTCNRVIKELYEFTHEAKLEKTKVKLKTISMELEEYADSIIGQKIINFETENNLVKFHILIDKFKIMQALKNIISNSCDAIVKKGAIKVTFGQQNNHLTIDILDTGSGMSKEALGKIFEPFFTSKSKGFGLGLAIVKNIIERHDGTIMVDSQLSKGTRTKIKLPGLEKMSGEVNE